MATTLVLLALSIIPDVVFDGSVATRLLLMSTHVIAAVIIVPVLAVRLPRTVPGDPSAPVVVRPPADVEVRPADLPRRVPGPVAGLAGGAPRPARGVWLCSWRTPTGRPACPYAEAVEEAICFGWIDATVNVLDDDRALQLMTPRKAKGTWTG